MPAITRSGFRTRSWIRRSSTLWTYGPKPTNMASFSSSTSAAKCSSRYFLSKGAWSYPVSHGNRRPLRIPDSADIDFRALERALLPKSLTRKLQEAAQLWSHSSVRGIEDVHCGIGHRVLRQQTHQCPIAQCIANQLYRL